MMMLDFQYVIFQCLENYKRNSIHLQYFEVAAEVSVSEISNLSKEDLSVLLEGKLGKLNLKW